MNKKLKKLFLSFVVGLIGCMCIALAACNRSKPSLSLSEEELSLFAGESHTLTVDVKDINENLVWQSSDETILNVTPSDDGKSATVYAFKAGSATVTVSGGKKEAVCNVSVSDVTTVSSIEITYDNSSDVKLAQGSTLSFAKLKARTNVDGLQYRFTIKHGDGTEQNLTADYTLSDKGVYTVTAYITTAGYEGSDTLEITVAESVTDLTLQYGNGSETVYVGQYITLSRITAASATATANGASIGYRLVLPDGTVRELDNDYRLEAAGDYVLEAYIKGADYVGSTTVTVSVLPKTSLTSKMTLKYNGVAIDGGLEHEISTAYDLSKFTVETEDNDGINYVWKLNGQSVVLADETAHEFATAAKYTLTAIIDEISVEGEKSVEITVYKNHQLTLVGANKAIVDEDNSFTAQTEEAGLNYKYEVSYDGGTTYAAYSGAFTAAGTAKIKASVSDASTLNRGEAVKEVTVYELGTTYTVNAAASELSLILGTGKRASDKTIDADLSTAQNTYTVNGGTPATTELVSFNEEVATVGGNTATAVSNGLAKVYAILDGKAYLAYKVSVKTYANYYVIQDVSDINAVKDAPALTYVLKNDIDLNERVGCIVNTLTGVLDGNGHTLKNGVLDTTSNSDNAYFFYSISGTVKNIAFVDIRTTNGTVGSSWKSCGITYNLGENALLENAYVEMTVNGVGQQAGYNAILVGNLWSNGAVVRNVIVNATYPKLTHGDFTDPHYATLVGTLSNKPGEVTLENCYAIVGGGIENDIPCIDNDKTRKDLNYASLAALQADKGELFEEGGAFTGAFWEECIVNINRPVFKAASVNYFVGEEFTEADIFYKNATAVTISEPSKLSYASGKFTAVTSGNVTLTVTYNGEPITMTVVISNPETITDAQLSYNDATPLAVGSTIDASKFVVTSGAVGTVTVKDFKIKKQGDTDYDDADGFHFTLGGTYEVTAVVTQRGYTGPLSFELTIERGIAVTSNLENANLTIYPTQTVTGTAYSDDSEKTATVTATAEYTDNHDSATVTNYTSSDTSVATVTSAGVITAVGNGTCEIKAVVNGNEYKVCTVTVTSYADYKAVATLADVNKINDNAAGKYVMVNDIDLNGRTGSIASAFSGTFDGNGHALKNGYLDIGGSTSTDKLIFFGDFKGTLKNIAFIGFSTSTGTNDANSGWQASGILQPSDNCVIENVYIEMTVNGNGTQNCNGILGGSYWNNGAKISNVIINATYTGKFDKFATVIGGLDTKKTNILSNVYAIVNGVTKTDIPSNCQDSSTTYNYSSLAELKAAKGELFEGNGVFTGAFWEDVEYYISGGMSFKNLTKELFAGETFNLSDIVNTVDAGATVEVTSGTQYLGYSSGAFTAQSAGTAVVTLTNGAHVEKLTVTVNTQNALSDITLTHGSGGVLQLGDKLIKANIVATSTSEGVLNSDYCVYTVKKDGTDVEWSGGEITLEAGNYVVTLTVTNPASGLVGSTATLNITISAEVITVTNADGTSAKLYAEASLERASGGTYNLDHTVTLNVTATSSVSGTPTVSGYKSSNEAVATVSAQGVITAVAQGTAIISATVNGTDYPVFTVNVVSFAGYKALEDLADINAVASTPTGNYLMVADIDLNSREGIIADTFSGIFDGNGHALKNGVLKLEGNSKERVLFYNMHGTLKNIAFLGFSTTNGVVNSTWEPGALMYAVNGNSVVENVYVEMTVNGTGANASCNGILLGNVWNSGAKVKNVIVNATYPSVTDDNVANLNFATIFGTYGSGTVENVYAIVNGGKEKDIPCYDDKKAIKDYNYASLDALRTAQPELFADGGVFATDFWKEIIESMQQA